MNENEQLSEKEMGLLAVILGDKPVLRNKIFALLAEGIPVGDVTNDLVTYDEAGGDDLPVLIQNAIECHTCGAILNSTHRHDFVACACGNATDGGIDYIRRIGNPENMSDLSLHTDSPRSDVRIRLLWGTYGINGDQPKVYKRVMDLETAHLEAILKTQKHISPMVRTAIQDNLDLRKDAAGN
jgi:hypothetical protein